MLNTVDILCWLNFDKHLRLLLIALVALIILLIGANIYNSNLSRHVKGLEAQVQEMKARQRQLVMAKPTSQGLTLEGIMKQNDEFMVIINSTVLAVGDTLENYQVREIYVDRVVLVNQKTKEEKILALPQVEP